MAGKRVAPRGLGDQGKRLWRAVVEEYALSESDAAQLEQCCRVRDRIDQLQQLVVSDGPMIPSSQGQRLHPAIVEVRQQQLALARLLATLGVDDEEDDLPPARPVRGVYGPKAVKGAGK